MKQRLLLCLLLTLSLIYMAIPRLPMSEEGLGSIFSLMWLGFALIVFAGNLTGLLYSKKVQPTNQNVEKRQKDVRKLRRYSR